MAFSTAVKIAQLDDFISPSQDCIIPIMNKDKKLDTDDPTYMYSQAQESNLILTNSKTKTAEISLSDCLACSGCVTTAESILKQEQSIQEFQTKIQECAQQGGKNIVIMSSQALASISHHFKLETAQMTLALHKFFDDNFGDNITFYDNMNLGIALALNLCAIEYKQKLEQKQKLPIISSECPGWTCYAEKQAPENIIQHMSKVKSPQQILGTLFKTAYKQKYDIQKISVTVIMPCYDKKVESARKEFEREQLKDIDSVLTTTELMDLIKEIEGPKLKEGQQDTINSTIFPYHDYLASQNQQELALKNKRRSLENDLEVQINDISQYFRQIDLTSNGYLEFIINYVAVNIYNLQKYEIQKQQLKNADLIEYTLYEVITQDVQEEAKQQGQHSNQQLKKIDTFARVYGLKNIQNLLRNIKVNKCKFSYVEVMACPSGCVNGGGQLKSLDENIKSKDFNALISQKLNQFSQEQFENVFKQQVLHNDQFIQLNNLVQKIESYNNNTNNNILQVNYKHIEKDMSMQAFQW